MLDTFTLSFLPTIDDLDHPGYLLNGKHGQKNDCGVYTTNVFRFLGGNFGKTYVEIKLCAVGDFVFFNFTYGSKSYGTGYPLSDESRHTCHRANSAKFLADRIYDVFRNSVVTYDKDLEDRPKDKKELVKMCRKACDKICNEVR